MKVQIGISTLKHIEILRKNMVKSKEEMAAHFILRYHDPVIESLEKSNPKQLPSRKENKVDLKF
jgi:hypothetical protein